MAYDMFDEAVNKITDGTLSVKDFMAQVESLMATTLLSRASAGDTEFIIRNEQKFTNEKVTLKVTLEITEGASALAALSKEADTVHDKAGGDILKAKAIIDKDIHDLENGDIKTVGRWNTDGK